MANATTVRPWGYAAVGVVGAVAIAAVPALLLAHPGASALATRLWIMVLAASLAMAWAGAFATLAYRGHEEYVREAQKFAWYWGGPLGAGVSLPIFVLVMVGGPQLIGAEWPAAQRHAAFLGFFAGYLLLAVGLIVGMGVARLWWAVSKR